MLKNIYNFNNMKKGLLIILSGPSGVGKGTVKAILMQDKELNLNYSISMTTRKPRLGEIDGVDYFFVSKERFNEAISKNELLEHAIFVNNYYGTPKCYVDQLLNEGKNVLLEIETFGAQQVMDIYKDYGYISIFLKCCDLQELEKRIRGRRSESEEVIHQRLSKAKKELLLEKNYQYSVLNDDVNRAANEIISIIKNHQL